MTARSPWTLRTELSEPAGLGAGGLASRRSVRRLPSLAAPGRGRCVLTSHARNEEPGGAFPPSRPQKPDNSHLTRSLSCPESPPGASLPAEETAVSRTDSLASRHCVPGRAEQPGDKQCAVSTACERDGRREEEARGPGPCGGRADLSGGRKTSLRRWGSRNR